MALSIALYHLGGPSLWMDEALSLEHVRQPPDIFWASFTSGFSAYMYLYFLILNGWLHLTSWAGLAPTEFIIRFPSAVFGALTAVVVFLLGRRFISRGAGLAAAALCMLNPWQLAYSQEARSYSLLLFLSSFAWYALLVALSDQVHRKRWWIVYALASALATYAHILNVLLIFAQVILFGCLFVLPTPWRERVRTKWLPMLVSLCAVGVLIAPLAYVSRSGAWHTGWVQMPTISELAQRIVQKYFGGAPHLVIALVIALLVLFALGALLLVMVARRRGSEGIGELARRSAETARRRLATVWPGALAVLCWFLVPLVVSWAISQQGTARIFTGRYLVGIAPAMCLLFGIAIMTLPSRVMQALALVAVLGATALTLPQYYAHAQVEDWRTPTHWLEQRYQLGDGLVSFSNGQGCELAIEAYLQTDHSAAHFTPDSPGVMSWAGMKDGNPFPNAGVALDVHALAVFAANHPRIFYIAGRLSDSTDIAGVQTVIQWLDAHYRLIDQTSSNIVTIRLYDTTTVSNSMVAPTN